MILSEPDLNAYLDKYFEKRFSRLVENRFFQGIVTAVDYTVTPAQIQVQRIGEAEVDSTPYACLIPACLPVLGDRVLLVWISDSVAVAVAMVSRRLHTEALFDHRQWFSTAQRILVPAGINHVRLRIKAVNNTTANTLIQFNDDPGTNYSWEELAVTGAAAAGGAAGTSVTGIRVGVNNNAVGLATQMDVDIDNVANGTVKKTLLARQTRTDTTTALFTGITAGFWNNIAVIGSITVTASAGAFVAGSSWIDAYGSV